MATAITSTRAAFEALSQSAHIDVLLPRESDVHFATLIDAGGQATVSRVPTRRNLFFDEQANVFVLLKTAAKEAAVRSILPELELVLAAHATDAVPQGNGNAASASGKHDLNNDTLKASDFHEIIATAEHTYVVWQRPLHLVRPRARLHRPAIYFTANLAIQAQSGLRPSVTKDLSLVPFQPLPANVLEPLSFGCFAGAASVSISESRITKVAPKSSNIQDLVRPIRGATRRAFPIVPALFSRIRYSTLPDAIVASLHLETSHIVAGRTQILHAGLTVANADVKSLTDVALPLEAHGGDEVVLLYKVLPDNAITRQISAEHSSVSVSVKAEATLDQGSHILLDIEWEANIDLTHIWQAPIYQWSRPAGRSSHHKSLSEQSWSKPTRHVTSDADGGTEGGVIFNFGAPATSHDTTEFRISVHCNNRSSRPRRFGLVMTQPYKSRISAPANAASNRDSGEHSDPFEHKDTIDVLDLNPDVRIGPLPSRACFESHLLFKALRAGVLNLGTLKIMDLDTRQTVDVRELPDTIAPTWTQEKPYSAGGQLQVGTQVAQSSATWPK